MHRVVTWLGRGRGRVVVLVVAVVVAAGAVVAAAEGLGSSERRDSGSRDAGAVASTDQEWADGATPTTVAGEGFAGDAADEAPFDPEVTAGRAGVVPVNGAGPRVVRTASLQVEVADGAAAGAVDEAATVAAELGGFVTEAQTRRTDVGGTSGTVTVRVPVDRFDEARRRLGALGEVREESVNGEDVTGQLVDLDARLRSLQAEEEAYRTLLGRAQEVGDVLVVQEELFAVRTEIEQLQAQQAALADAADFATLRVGFVEPGAPAVTTVPSEPSLLAQGVERAVGATLAVLAGTLVVLGYVVPLSLLAAVAWGIWTLLRRSRRPAAPPAVP